MALRLGKGFGVGPATGQGLTQAAQGGGHVTTPRSMRACNISFFNPNLAARLMPWRIAQHPVAQEAAPLPSLLARAPRGQGFGFGPATGARADSSC